MGRAKRKMPSTLPQFLNVDLEVETRVNPELLVSALAKSTVLLASFKRRNIHVIRLELRRSPKTATAAIRAFVRLVQRLPPTARKAWRTARRRDFDAGFELGTQRRVLAFSIPPEVVQQASAIGGRVVFTIYPAPSGPRGKPRSLPDVRLE